MLPLDQARAQLAALPIRSEDTGAHYRRTDWGDWAYDPATKCSTRERVLRRDGTGVQVDEHCRPHCPARPPAPACWTSRYDNAAVYEAARLQVDHVVALAQSARSGARNWTRAQREAHKEGIIGGKAARRELGFDEDDKPDPDELAARQPTEPAQPGVNGESGGQEGGQATPGQTPKPPASPGGQPAARRPPAGQQAA